MCKFNNPNGFMFYISVIIALFGFAATTYAMFDYKNELEILTQKNKVLQTRNEDLEQNVADDERLLHYYILDPCGMTASMVEDLKYVDYDYQPINSQCFCWYE
jgi:hypothetical protein